VRIITAGEIFGPGAAYAVHQMGQARPWSFPEQAACARDWSTAT